MITVHHLRPSRAERIVWLVEELGLEYAVEVYDRDPATFRSPASLRAVHPLGKSPVLTDGDLVVIESGAIVEYLVETYGPHLAPAPGEPARKRYLEWLHWSEGSAAGWLVMDLLVNGGMVPGLDPGPLAAMLPAEIGAALDWVEGELDGQAFACGAELTAADPMLWWVLGFARDRGHLGERKAIIGYLERLEARDAFQRAASRTA